MARARKIAWRQKKEVGKTLGCTEILAALHEQPQRSRDNPKNSFPPLGWAGGAGLFAWNPPSLFRLGRRLRWRTGFFSRDQNKLPTSRVGSFSHSRTAGRLLIPEQLERFFPDWVFRRGSDYQICRFVRRTIGSPFCTRRLWRNLPGNIEKRVQLARNLEQRGVADWSWPLTARTRIRWVGYPDLRTQPRNNRCLMA